MKLKQICLILFLLQTTYFKAQNIGPSMENPSRPYDFKRLDSLMNILDSKEKFMGNIMVSEDGKIIYSKSIGYADVESKKKATISTNHRVGSISKMFTSCLVFKAIEEKKLALEWTLDTYFPEIENAKKITIGNLLNHHSGIFNFTNDSNYYSYYSSPKTEKEMIDIIKKGSSIFEPGTKGEYSNTNYVILSFILQKVYNQPFSQLLASKIVKPLGLKNTYVGGKVDITKNECHSYTYVSSWEKEPETDLTIPMGAGAIVSNAEDLIKFSEGLFNGKIITKGSFNNMKLLDQTFGYGIFQFPFFDKKGLGHTGGIDGFRSMLVHYPSNNLTVAMLSNGAIFDAGDVFLAALSCYYNKDFSIPQFKTLSLKSEDLDQYLGLYTSAEIPIEVNVFKEGSILKAQGTSQKPFPLEATELHKFEFLTGNIVMVFNPIDKTFTLYQSSQTFNFKIKPKN